MTTKQKIAREMLRIYDGKAERWCQGTLKKWADDVDSDEPCAWCMLGASAEACERLRLGTITESDFDEYVARKVGEDGVDVWNDAPERTFDDVVQLLTSIAESAP